MKIAGKTATVFKIKNRQGYAAICSEHVTEGSSPIQATARMVKALARTARKAKKGKK
jgi:hypothetical protein